MSQKSMIKGASIISLGVIITKLLGVLYAIPFSAMIGDEGGALYTYGYSVYIMFINISVAGIPFGIAKLISQYDSLNKYQSMNKAYEVSKRLMFAISGIVFVLMFVLAKEYAIYVLSKAKDPSHTVEEVTWAIRSVSFALLVVPYLAFSRGYLQGFQIMTTNAISQVVEQVARIIFLLGGVYLCLYVYDLGMVPAIYAALFAALVGALFGYLVVSKRSRKQKQYVLDNLDLDKHRVDTTKEILRKLFSYSIPFILLSVMLQLYNQVNVATIVNILDSIGYDTKTSQSVLSAICTWGPKLNRIIFAFTVGLTTSMLPAISKNYARGEHELVKSKSEKAMMLILLLVGYLSFFLSLFHQEVYAFFFSTNVMGPVIYKVAVFTTIFHSFMYVTSVILQSVNRQYIASLTMLIGVLVKIVTNEPLVHFFNMLRIEASYGFIVSTILGFFTTIVLNLVLVKRFADVNVRVFLRRVVKLVVILLVTFGITFVVKLLVPYSPTGRIEIMIYCGVFGAFSLAIYLYLGFFSKLIQRALGDELVLKLKSKFLSKLRIKKL